MFNDDIRTLWDSFIEDFKQYFNKVFIYYYYIFIKLIVTSIILVNVNISC